MKAGSGDAGSDRGFALLIVLWTLVLVALIVTGMVASARQQTRLAGNLRTAAQLGASAEGGLYVAIFHILDGGRAHWKADGTVHQLEMDSAAILIQVSSEAGKININSAQAPVLAALLQQAGMAANAADAAAANIVAWRSLPGEAGPVAAQYRAAGLSYTPPNAPFESRRELGRVLGMQPTILRRVLPYITIHHDGDTDPLDAPQMILRVLKQVYGQVPVSGKTEPDAHFVTIRVTAERGGAKAAREAVVEIGPLSDGRLFKILDVRLVGEPALRPSESGFNRDT